MIELFVTVNEIDIDKQHIGSFEFNTEAKEAMEKVTTKLFKQNKNCEMITFQITGYGKDQFYTKKRPETGAFANTTIRKNVYLLLELDKLNVELIDESKAMEVVEEIEAKEMTIKQWVKENSKKVQPF